MDRRKKDLIALYICWFKIIGFTSTWWYIVLARGFDNTGDRVVLSILSVFLVMFLIELRMIRRDLP